MESVAFIQWCLDHLNYWTITLLMTIESSFIPFPSEVVVPPAAYKAAVNEELNIYLVVLFATLGANLGAIINYYLARWLGRPIVYKFANSRFEWVNNPFDWQPLDGLVLKNLHKENDAKDLMTFHKILFLNLLSL